MIRHSPAEMYIKYLLAHPDRYSNDTVIELLQLKQLDFIGPSYLERLRRSLRTPFPFRPQDRLHRPSMKFIMQHQSYYLFHPDKPMERALYLLDNPKAKEVLETTIITNDPIGLISHRMNAMGMECDTRTVERYRFFFFNTDLVDVTELRALIYLRSHFVPENSDEYEDQVRGALKKTAFRDPRRALADHPMPFVASVMNQMRLGFLPTQFDIAKLLRTARDLAIAQVASSGCVAGRGDAAAGRDYSMTAKMMQELMMDIGSPDLDLRKELQMLALRTEQVQLPYVKELTDGSYTVDVQPIEQEDATDAS